MTRESLYGIPQGAMGNPIEVVVEMDSAKGYSTLVEDLTSRFGKSSTTLNGDDYSFHTDGQKTIIERSREYDDDSPNPIRYVLERLTSTIGAGGEATKLGRETIGEINLDQTFVRQRMDTLLGMLDQAAPRLKAPTSISQLVASAA